MVIICFSIFSGIDCSESFHISHLYDSTLTLSLTFDLDDLKKYIFLFIFYFL